MKALSTRIVALALVAGLLAATQDAADAGGLEPGHVDTKAKWLLHVDFDAARKTEAFQRIESGKQTGRQLQAAYGWLKQRYGIEQSDLRGLTLYGTGPSESEAAAVFYADFTKPKVKQIVKKQPQHRTLQHGEYILHVWSARDEELPEDDERHRASVAFVEGRIAVFTKTPKRLRRALDVVTQDAGRKDRLRLETDAPRGTVLFATATDVASLSEKHVDSPILKRMKQLTVALGESPNDQAFGHVRVESRSKKLATQLRDVAEGLQAFGQLAATELEARDETKYPVPDDLRQLVSLQVDQKGNAVRVRWTADAEALVEHAAEAVQKFLRNQDVSRNVGGEGEEPLEDASDVTVELEVDEE